MSREVVRLYSICKVGENGSGAYASVLQGQDRDGQIREKYITQGETFAGQSRLQLRGIVEALEALHRPVDIEVYTDSKFIIDTIRNHWIEKWVENDWQRGKMQPVQNVELWIRLVNLMELHNIRFRRIKTDEVDDVNAIIEACEELLEETYRNTLLIEEHLR